MYELVPRYSSRKSFYGKAQVKKTNYEELILYELFSYSTKVAKIEKTKNKITYFYLGHYSSTTTSHQKEFFKQNGLSDKEIKKLIKNEKLEIEVN
jgi:hypothetical protein